MLRTDKKYIYIFWKLYPALASVFKKFFLGGGGGSDTKRAIGAEGLLLAQVNCHFFLVSYANLTRVLKRKCFAIFRSSR